MVDGATVAADVRDDANALLAGAMPDTSLAVSAGALPVVSIRDWDVDCWGVSDWRGPRATRGAFYAQSEVVR